MTDFPNPEIRQALADTLPPGPMPGADQSFAVLRARMETAHGETPSLPGIPVRQAPRISRNPAVVKSSVFRYAAGIAAIVLVAIAVPVLRQSGTSDSGRVQQREYTTDRGQRSSFTLPDGSRVVLAPATTLAYDHQGNTRTLTLDGEAYFTVTPNSDHPFIVRTASAATQVLGTSFSVRSYASDKTTQVAVAEGKVSTEGTVLVAGDVGRVGVDGRVMVARDVEIATAFGWTLGKLVYKNARLGDVIPDLERHYNVTITVADPAIRDMMLTVSLSDESVPDMLNTIVPALDISYERHNDTIVLRSLSSTSRSR